MKTKALWIFLGTVAVTVGLLLVFIQSKYFADALKQTARRYMPSDLGMEGDFSELAVKLIPPGIVVKNPAVVFKDKNPAGLPAGTKLDAEFIDVTFQLFQLLTGEVTINAFSVHGAKLKLELDRQFFAAREKALQPKKRRAGLGSWDKLLRFNFRSVSLVDSQVDLSLEFRSERLRLRTYAKELTVGRSTVDKLPGYDLALDFQKAFVEFPGFTRSLAQLQASVEISSQGASIRNLSMQDGDMNVHMNGVIAGNVLNPSSLKADLSSIFRGPVQAWLDPGLIGRFARLPKGTEVAGAVSVETKLKGDLLDLKDTAEAKATVHLDGLKLAGWSVDNATLKGAWKGGVIALDSAELSIGEGTVRATRVVYDMSRREQSMRAYLEFDKADLRRLLGPGLNSVYPLHMKLDGSANVEAVLGPKLAVEGTADLVVRDFALDNQKPGKIKPRKVVLAVPRLTLKTGFKIDAAGARFDRAEVTMPRSKLRASGAVGVEGFDLDIRGNVDMADVGAIAEVGIGGAGSLRWTVTGKMPHVVLAFEPDLQDAQYLNLKLGAVKGRIVYEDAVDLLSFHDLNAVRGRTRMIANGTINVGDAETVDLRVQVPNGTVEDFGGVFSGFLKDSVPWYPWELTGKMTGLITVTGKTALEELSAEGDMELRNVDYRHETFHYVRMHAGYRRGAYVAENVAAQKKVGWIRGNLIFDAGGDFQFDAKSEGLTTYDVDHLAIFGIPYRAPIALETRGSGKLGALKSRFRLLVGDGVVKNYPVAASEVSFATEDGRLSGSASIFGGRAQGKVDLGWAKGASSSFEIDVKDFDFRPVLIALNPDLFDDPGLEARASGGAQLKFQTGALSRLTGQVSFDGYQLKRTGYSLELPQPLRLDIRDGNYDFHDAKLVGTGTSITASGRVRNGEIDYDIKGDFSLGLAEFLVKEIASLRGSAQVSAKLFGRADGPNLRADVVSKGADLRLRHVEQPFEDLKFTARWIDDAIKVTGITSKFAGGGIKAEGDAKLYYYKAPDLDFRGELNNAKVKVYPVAYARTTGKLSCQGTKLPYKVKGDLFVSEAMVKENFSQGDGARVLRSSKFLPQTKGRAAGEIELFDLDIGVAADRGVFVRNDFFDVELKGSIKIINTLAVPRLMGAVSILHGRLFFKDNYFTVQHGDLRFANPAALDPEFDLSGQTDVKGYKVLLVAAGRVSDYRLDFQSQPPLSQNDIVNLLTLGVTSSDFKSISRENRDAYSRDELYGLLFNQSGINKGLQEKLGVKVKVDQTQSNTPENVFRARQSTDAAESVAPKVVLQKQITKNLNASVGSTVGVGGSQERNADVELGIGRNWSILGTYEDQRGSQLKQSRTSIGADLKYKLRFK